MPRPRKQEKTVDIKGSVSEATYDAIVELAKASGISIRQLVNQVLTDYIANQNPKSEMVPKTGFYVGVEVRDPNFRDTCEDDEAIVTLYKELEGKGVVVDKGLFLAHNFLWRAFKRSNGTYHRFKAIYEAPDEALIVVKRKDKRERLSTCIREALRAYENILTTPGYDRLPLRDRKAPKDREEVFEELYELALKDDLTTHQLSEVRQKVAEALENLEPKEASVELTEALELNEANQELDAVLEVTEDSPEAIEEMMTTAEAVGRFGISKNSINKLTVGGCLPVPNGGHLTKRQRENGTNELVFIPQLALV